MSFASQVTICRHDDNSAVTPTEQELQLSRLVRPGMNGERRIKQILPRGKYAYNPAGSVQWTAVDWERADVTESRRNIVRAPKRVRLEGVSWQQYQELNWTGHLSSASLNLSAPIDDADDAGLGYYNCRLLTPGDVITLNHRSMITDFHYHDDYFDQYVIGVLGSSFIEQHEFAHVDTPLGRRSGYLVLGKMDRVSQALELTAFAVRPEDSVYIPAKTIHTNDYLLGIWETLLSSSCEFPSAQIKRPGHEPLRFVSEHNH